MREKLLLKLARAHSHHPGYMLVAVLILTAIFIGLSTQLTQTMRWSDLLPEGDPRTTEYNRILEEFVTASSIIIVVQGEEHRIKSFAEAAIPRLLAAVDTERDDFKLVQRVDYKMELDFLRGHGLMLLKAEDLKNVKGIFENPNLTEVLFHINNSLEAEYVGDSESMSTREKEDQAVQFLDGIKSWLEQMQYYAEGGPANSARTRQAVDKLLFGEPYLLSYDKTTLLLNVIPNFTMLDTDFMVSGTVAVQAIVDELLVEFPEVRAGLTGMIPLGHDEMVYAEKSIGSTSAIAFIAIFILLMLSFRMWVAPIFAIVNLFIGTLWAVGTVAAVVGQLNIMTMMFTVILLGLDIDFSIHVISGFSERRAAGDTIAEAMQETFLKSGKGIVMGGLTTAFAFLTMIISSSRGMKEMGLVTGAGLLAILLATLMFLPAVLVLRERRLDRKALRGAADANKPQRDISFRFLGDLAANLGRCYPYVLLFSLLLTALFAWAALRISFDQNYMNIEAKGLTSIALQDTVLEKYDLSMDYALILTESVDESRTLSKRFREMSSVAMTEDISIYLPSEEEQLRRIPFLADIARAMRSASIRRSITRTDFTRLVAEIERLEMNVMEMQDMAFTAGQDKVEKKCAEIIGDPENPGGDTLLRRLRDVMTKPSQEILRGLSALQNEAAPYYRETVLAMCSTDLITFDDLPVSILDRYSNKDRSHFLITVFPAGNMWQNAEFLKRFVSDLERVSDKATGMPPVFRALIEIIGRDGRNAALLTLVIVFVLLWLDFRTLKYVLIALIPLTVGVFWMVGLMHLFGLKLTVVNVMGIPMIIGIGIDDGVHIVHRWRSEGEGKLRTIFSSTGKAILLTSLTTMLAFGSLIFSVWRGFAQLGGALFIGVAACFLTTVIIIASGIGFLERKIGS